MRFCHRMNKCMRLQNFQNLYDTRDNNSFVRNRLLRSKVGISLFLKRFFDVPQFIELRDNPQKSLIISTDTVLRKSL